ncbi:MAG: hypothetical protein HY246_16065 [Proteobacteria bacterium]|nr:hypothetical protein [Pseudomonadota bacterium]
MTVDASIARIRTFGALLAGALIAGLPAAAGALDARAAGTQFEVRFDDGRVLRSPELVGAVLDLEFAAGDMKLKIDAVERDPLDATGRVWLHTLLFQAADGSWQNLCMAGPDGRRQGFPLAGPGGVGVRLVCTAGAQGKCVRFGYHPWSSTPAGRELAPLHAACVHMVRGDYCGDDRPSTENGTLIDVYDRVGVQGSGGDPSLAFEAAWGPEGAVCVHHTRVPKNLTLEGLTAKCPQLKQRVGAMCSENSEQSAGAVIFNRSRM